MTFRRTVERQPGDLGLLLLFFFSGGLALVHEVVWIRKLTLVFSATAPAVSIVLSVFFGGMALGAWLVARFWRGVPSPVRLYAAMEAGIGIWALLFPSLLSVTEPVYAWLYVASEGNPTPLFVARATLVCLLLLAPSALMGATLPVLVRHFVLTRAHVGARVAGLYAVNTFGGALGTFAAGFWSIKTLGVDGTIYAAAVANLLTACMAWALARRQAVPGVASIPAREASGSPTWSARARIAAGIAFGVSGFTGLAYEVVWTRYLSLFMTASVYAYSTMLTVFLLGLALGSLAVARWADKYRDLPTLFGYLQLAIGVASIALFPSMTVLAASPLWARVGDPTLVQFSWCAVLMILPTTLMGAVFPLVSKIATVEARGASAAVGSLYALNTAGAILGSMLAGFVLIPAFGMQGAVILLASVSIAIGVAALAYEPARHWRRAALGLAASLFAIALVRQFLPLDLPRARLQYVAGLERVVDLREGRLNSVWVAEDEWGRRSLWGNTSVLGRTRRLGRPDLSAQRVQGHIPLLLHPGNPQDVLGIGFGTGQTFAAQLLHPIRRLDVVEISPEVVELALAYFGKHRDGFHPDPRARIIIDDGRTFVAFTPQRYDVISLEMPPQAEAGVVHFYTREFYALARARLAPGGVLAQWLPIYNVGPEEARSIARTLLTVFPQSALWHNGANLLLLGFNGTFELSVERVRERLQRGEVARDLAVSYLGDSHALLSDPNVFLGGFLMGPAQLEAFTRGASIYTDNSPALEFTWTASSHWGPEGPNRLILANTGAIRSHLEGISQYLREAPREAVVESEQLRDRYLQRLEAIAADNLATLAMRRGGVADALALYRRAIALSPDFAQAHVNLGSLLQRTGQLNEGEAEYLEGLRIEPRYAEAHYGLGTLWEQRHRPSEATRAYQRALEIKDDFALARARLARLAPVQNSPVAAR